MQTKFTGYRCDRCGGTNCQIEAWTEFDTESQTEIVRDDSGGGWYCPDCCEFMAPEDSDFFQETDGHDAQVSQYDLEGEELAKAQAYAAAQLVRDAAPDLLATLRQARADIFAMVANGYGNNCPPDHEDNPWSSVIAGIDEAIANATGSA